MPYAQRTTQKVSVATTGATEIDATGYAHVRIYVDADDVRLAFDAVSLDSQYFLISAMQAQPYFTLDGINATLYLRAQGAGPACTVHLLMWN